MAERTPLTLEQHKILGQRLFQVQRDLRHIFLFISSKYPDQKAIPVRRAMDAIAYLRSEMEQELYEEGHVGKDLPLVYYPPPETD